MDDGLYINTYVQSLSPTDFEKYCMAILIKYAESQGIRNVKIIHNTMIKAADGEYQIDVYAEFKALGGVIKVLCECKHYKDSVERKVVAELQQKLQSTGANKGMVFSTAGFQSGAIQFAEQHGIALIRVYDNYEQSFSMGPSSTDRRILAKKELLRKNYPKICADIITDEKKQIYPTNEMRKLAFEKTSKQFLEMIKNGEI